MNDPVVKDSYVVKINIRLKSSVDLKLAISSTIIIFFHQNKTRIRYIQKFFKKIPVCILDFTGRRECICSCCVYLYVDFFTVTDFFSITIRRKWLVIVLILILYVKEFSQRYVSIIQSLLIKNISYKYLHRSNPIMGWFVLFSK